MLVARYRAKGYIDFHVVTSSTAYVTGAGSSLKLICECSRSSGLKVIG
jgi:hypothetical protein